MKRFCRDCLLDTKADQARCPQCGSRRILADAELDGLSIAHVDCDAFYAAIEKRDDPELRDRPVIVGGRKRGVVLTACYIARIKGVKSAMPMFRATALCPEAVIVRPRMSRYAEAAKSIRAMMRELTPLVQPLSLDEAWLDLTGTERLHGMSPAKTMARLAKRIEAEIGVTVSVGLSFNRFLAKLASDLDKPRGFAVIGRKWAKAFLRDKPIGLLRGVGASLQARLASDGYREIGQLQDADRRELASRYGITGLWLARLANAEDGRAVNPAGERKTISSETTFNEDIAAAEELEEVLWRQSERISQHAKAVGLGGRTVILKLKTADFRIRTRSTSLDTPTQLADRIFKASRDALHREADGTKFRLLGVGLAQLYEAAICDPVDLVDNRSRRSAAAERAIDRLREKFGPETVAKGRSMGRQASRR